MVRDQFKGSTFRYGEGNPHERAKFRLVSILQTYHWEKIETDKPWDVRTTWGWKKEDDPKIKYYHEYDVYAEFKHSNGLISRYIFEIDGSSHEKKHQKNHDRTAEDYANFFELCTRFVRMDIGLLLNYSMTDEGILDTYKIPRRT